jgi:hypothetical protein
VNLPLVVAVIAAKFLLPVAYLRFPFAAGWANFALDSLDGDILIPAGLDPGLYQTLDKAADWVTYLFIFLWAWRRPIRREITATFALRTVGQAMFFATHDEMMLFFFPNLLEPLFLVYVTIGRFRGGDRAQAIYRAKRVVIWLCILAYKFQDEWFTHVANVDRTEFLKGLFR